MKKNFLIISLIFFINISFSPLLCNGQIAWQWAKSYGGLNDQSATDLVLDSVGNIYVTGSFWHSATFGNEIFTANPNYGYGGFVGKYDNIGNLIWSRQINMNTEDRYGNALCLDKNQNIYVTGAKINNTDVSGNSYLKKYSNDGTELWVKSFEKEIWDDDRHKSIGILKDIVCVSTKNNMYSFDSTGNLLSNIYLSVNCIADNGTNYFYAAKDNQIYVIDSSLSVIKTITVDFSNYKVTAISSKNDYIYIGGFFTKTVGGDRHMLLAKLDEQGEVIWSKTSNGEEFSNAQLNGILIDNNNKICITGSYFGKVQFDSLTIDSWGFSSEVFVARYDDITGDLEALIHGGGMGSDIGNCLALDADNDLIIAGMISEPMATTFNFGDIMLPFPAENGIDLFIAKVYKSSFNSIINGRITINDEGPIFSYVALYREKEDSTFDLINRNWTYPTGNFSFTVNKEGKYLIKTEKYKQINTYYNQDYLWNLADKIEIKTDTVINNINIDILQCEQLTGEDSISGRIYSYDGPFIKPVQFLLVSTDDSLISFTTSDSVGYYCFANVPKGQYKILIDSAGITMDSYYTIINSKKSVSTLLNGNSFKNCDYEFRNNHKIYKKISTFIESTNYNPNALVIYPNPSNTYIEVRGEIGNSDVSFMIFDLYGRCLYLSRESTPISKIDIQFLKNGMYYLYLDNNNGWKQIVKFNKIE